MSLGSGDLALLAAAGLGAGLANGVAGGGTLVSFPALLAVGLPALRANVTSTVGIWPGYIGGVAGFRTEVKAQPRRVATLAVPAILGATAGSVLLLSTPSTAFRQVIPYLVLAACALFGIQPSITRYLRRKRGLSEHPAVAWAGTLVGSVYGGYFGAGLGVVLLALLGLLLPDDLVRTNGVRSVLSLSVNTAAAVVFLVHGDVAWSAAAVLAVSSLVGGYTGARLARRMPAILFRVVVICLGLATASALLAG